MQNLICFTLEIDLYIYISEFATLLKKNRLNCPNLRKSYKIYWEKFEIVSKNFSFFKNTKKNLHKFAYKK